MQTSFDIELKGTSPVLLDGGLGTTLEDLLGLNISNSPLWSSLPVINAAEALVKAHLLFLQAGARIISTSTYQCSVETIEAAGLPTENAQAIMRESVRLAKVAKLTFLEERKASDKVYIALSLGPFGATLKPTQEFRGVYPPPFGPRQFNSEGENVNSFGPDKTGEQQAIDALYEFHLKRLSVFASDPETWNAIDFLAFETVPLTREVVAIRKAVTKLYDKIQEDLGQEHLKPWWISCVFPGGNSPEQSRHDGGSNLGIEELLVSAFKDVPDLTSDGRLLTPPGFGINCTSTRYLRTLTREVQLFYRREALSNPWLVIYPNGNEVYDEESRAWSTQSKAEKTWADEVGALAREIGEEEQLHGTTVGGIIIGGCCKTGPNDISTLSTILYKNR